MRTFTHERSWRSLWRLLVWLQKFICQRIFFFCSRDCHLYNHARGCGHESAVSMTASQQQDSACGACCLLCCVKCLLLRSRIVNTRGHTHNMDMFAPVPKRIVDIFSLIESFSQQYSRVTPICLRWSSLTFGAKELGFQLLTGRSVSDARKQ